MMGADLLKKTTDVLDEDLIATRLDGVITEKSNAVLTVSDKVESTTNRRGGDPVRDADPLESMIKGADFTCVIGRKEGPNPIRVRPVSIYTGAGEEKGRGGKRDRRCLLHIDHERSRENTSRGPCVLELWRLLCTSCDR